MSNVMQNPIAILIGFSLISALLTFAVRGFARSRGFVAEPKSDRWHTRPTAMLGGIAIFLTTVLGFLIFLEMTPQLIAIIGGGTLLFVFGLVDDLFTIKPYQKLIGQLIGASVLVSSGLVLNWTGNDVIDILITFVWVIGITNAINLLDNMDGLAGGIALIATATLAFTLYQAGKVDESLFLLSLAGALVGFLIFNFNPASIFMGDCGSMFVGFMISSSVLLSQTGGQSRGIVSVLAVPVLILFVPIFDTTLVTLMRKLSGRKASQGGRDHTSHRLVALGLSERKAVLMLYLFATAGSILAISVGAFNVTQSIAVIAVFAIALTILGVFLADVKVYDEESSLTDKSSSVAYSFILNLSHKRRIFEVFLDILLVTLSYYVAYSLADSKFTENTNWNRFTESLPIIVVAKISAFLVFGVYRGLWRYADVRDVISFGKAIVAGSGLSLIFLIVLFRFDEYSRTVFVLDALILFCAVSVSRFAFRLLRVVFPAPNHPNGRKVVIFGAGDGGEMLLRELRNNSSWEKIPVGFIDDDFYKKEKSIQGLPVLGGMQDLHEIVRRHGIQDVLVSIRNLPREDFSTLRRICADLNVGLFTAYIKIESVDDKQVF